MRSDALTSEGPAGTFTRSLILAAAFIALSGGLHWLVWIYGNGLRDPRYFDGWVLAGGMAFQLGFHVATKSGRLKPKSAMRWRWWHIFTGYALIATFVSHSDFSLPDTGFEWALWAGFVLVTISGIAGTYLAWTLRAKNRTGGGLDKTRIDTLRAEMAQRLHATVTETDQPAATMALPAPPYDAWLMDLYTAHLKDFFSGSRNSAAHLMGSKRQLNQLLDEIDSLSPFVDHRGKEKLAAIKALVIEKDRLDHAQARLAVARGCQFIHVPVTYSLVVLTVLHVVVVYSFSSGDW